MDFSSSDRKGSFSPRSISLRTTVISVSRSLRAMNECVIASADQRTYQSSVASFAAQLAK